MRNPTQKSKRAPGRPRKSDQDLKGCPVSLNLTMGQYDHFTAIAERMGQPLAPTIVGLALRGKIVSPLNKDEADTIRKANGMCNNLNQLAKAAHLSGMEDLADEICDTLNNLNSILLKIRK